MINAFVANFRAMPEAWLAASFSLVGSYLLAHHNGLGFAVHIGGNIFWVITAYRANLLPLIIIDAAYFAINLRGLVLWGIL